MDHHSIKSITQSSFTHSVKIQGKTDMQNMPPWATTYMKIYAANSYKPTNPQKSQQTVLGLGTGHAQG